MKSGTSTEKHGRARAGRMALLPLAALATTAGLTGISLGVAAPAGASSAPTTVKATETDFHIALSKKTFAPGKYTFVAVNKGQTTHALKITGTGMKGATTKDIGPGQQAKLTVTFKKGAYDIFCPVPGHKAMGMNVNITVGGASTTSKSSGSSGSSGGSSSGGGSGGYGY